MLTTFDLIFHCPENLRLVSTGELVSEEVAGGVRTVHRRNENPQPLAGFNLGNYTVASEDHGRYHIEFYADKSSALSSLPAIPAQTASVLDHYSGRWMPLPTRSLAISPIEGYFGQGFPGLIYLSNISYIREKDRPASLRNPRLNSFFSEVLLPHELAHQWWGNIVRNADYRTAWLMEAMANYSAFEFLERTNGAASIDTILAAYREDLSLVKNGKSVESAGPVDFGERLLENSGIATWHLILYEKGTWILHMLRRRLGDNAFQELQRRVLQQYAAKPLSNEDFRRLAAESVPAHQTDRSLSLFFETWIYGTGIPEMKLRQTSGDLTLTLAGVDDDFTADVPLRCKLASGKEQIQWVRASSGDNTFELPSGSRACALPATADFLFFPAN
jgi:aminopeptidase N